MPAKTPKTYKIGTRGSLLAITQCQQARDQLEALTGDKFQLEIIRTQGDEQTSKPLWQLEGKDFFTKELDAALLKGEIDLVVHSYKDLGSVRPEGIALAAVTERFLGHDILLMRPEALKEIAQTGEAVIGTSSPRRITNIEAGLSRFLPRQGGANTPKVSTKMLRGNVNTRIQKCRDGQFHGIVLAFAGLERLARDPHAREQLRPLVHDLEFLILPPSTFPWAASQGALGIECLSNRDDQNELFNKLALLNHTDSIEEIQHERKAFNAYGGGCHLAVGVAVQKVPELGLVSSHKGVSDSREIHQHAFIRETALPPIERQNGEKVFIGVSSEKQDSEKIFDKLLEKIPAVPQLTESAKPRAFYATHPQTLDAVKAYYKTGDTLWVAGTKTHARAAEKGLWVNGSSDALGDHQLKRFRDSRLLELMGADWSDTMVLSHKHAQSDLGAVYEGYQRLESTPGPDFAKDIEKCRIFYWTSQAQYEIYQRSYKLRADAVHFCGAGKTALKLKNFGLDVQVVAGMREFLEHVQLSS